MEHRRKGENSHSEQNFHNFDSSQQKQKVGSLGQNEFFDSDSKEKPQQRYARLHAKMFFMQGNKGKEVEGKKFIKKDENIRVI